MYQTPSLFLRFIKKFVWKITITAQKNEYIFFSSNLYHNTNYSKREGFLRHTEGSIPLRVPIFRFDSFVDSYISFMGSELSHKVNCYLQAKINIRSARL